MTATTMLRRVAEQPTWFLWAYLLLITLAELLTSFASPQLGLVIHALLLVGLTIHGAVGRPGPERSLVLALTLAPLIRLLSLSLPLAKLPQLAWYPIVSLPLMIASWIVTRLLRLSRQELGLCSGNLTLQLMLAGGGLGLGVLEYMILRPAPLITSPTWGTFLLAALVLIVFTGFTEELIFRGLLLSQALLVMGRWALVYASLLFAALHIGYLSLVDVTFVFAVGMLFAVIVRWSRSILGVSLAHGLTNVTLFLVMPYLAQQPSVGVTTTAPWVIGGGTAIAIVALFVMARANAVPTAIRPGKFLGQLGRALRAILGIMSRRAGESMSRHKSAHSEYHDQESNAMKTHPVLQVELASSETPERTTPPEIEQVMARISGRYIDDLRTLSEELSQFYCAQLAAKDEQIADLRRRLEAAERERDASDAQLREIKHASAKYITALYALSEELGRFMQAADGELDPVTARPLSE